MKRTESKRDSRTLSMSTDQETDSTGNHSYEMGKSRDLSEIIDEGSRVDESVHEESVADVAEEDGFEKSTIACLKYSVVILMMAATIGAGVATWTFLSDQENKEFNKEVSSDLCIERTVPVLQENH